MIKYIKNYSLIILFLTVGCTNHQYGLKTDVEWTTQQKEFIKYTHSFIGIPYLHAGTTRKGLDCSGFVFRVYQDFYQITLPKSVDMLLDTCHPISVRTLNVGDLVFFREGKGKKPSHVGIYLGNTKFIHASSKRGVRISKLSERYYKQRLCGVRRVKMH